jgi:segregation and condensation protein B
MNSEHEQNIKLEQLLEAILFWKGEPMSLTELSKSSKASKEEVAEALLNLERSLEIRGIVMIHNGDEVTLGTSKEASAVIEELTKEELTKDLGKASLETLSIILYKGPIKRSEIDYIRGVNSTFILRNLLIRGLIDKKPAPNDNRTSIYSSSFQLLSYLGVTKIEDLPNYEQVKAEILKFEDDQREADAPIQRNEEVTEETLA